mmetsp:Transcript_5005/g.12259  ORF Transcript_5005/g.12259 Transcript_5005/m.12259 type:complete len:201 (-) Transcript_5005:895-1497(-)
MRGAEALCCDVRPVPRWSMLGTAQVHTLLRLRRVGPGTLGPGRTGLVGAGNRLPHTVAPAPLHRLRWVGPRAAGPVSAVPAGSWGESAAPAVERRRGWRRRGRGRLERHGVRRLVGAELRHAYRGRLHRPGQRLPAGSGVGRGHRLLGLGAERAGGWRRGLRGLRRGLGCGLLRGGRAAGLEEGDVDVGGGQPQASGEGG